METCGTTHSRPFPENGRGCAWRVGLAVAVIAAAARAQVTQRVSLDSSGVQANADCFDAAISAGGRYVAFGSYATNLVSGDTNGTGDVFVRDRELGLTERVSVSSNSTEGNGQSTTPSISADGRYVAFVSDAFNLVAGDIGGWSDVFVRDRQLGVTERASVDSAGTQGNGPSTGCAITPTGRFVVFLSLSSNLVAGDFNGAQDVFVRDRLLATTERISVDSAGVEADGSSYSLSISADGRYVAFESAATNLVAGDTNGKSDIFVRDRQLGVTERVSVDAGGLEGNGDSALPSISSDGRFVAFDSFASNLVPGDTFGRVDVFVRDRLLATTERASVDSNGAQAFDHSYQPSISADGSIVTFVSAASNLVSGDTNGSKDIFIRDLQLGTTLRVSVSSAGIQGHGDSVFPSISADGRAVAFLSAASELIRGDSNGVGDVFVHDRFGGPGFTSLCDPGVGGVMGCPCANAPSGPDRGCDNSSGTGGAVLSASGGSFLSSDSLVFTTSDERPTALSILTQWTGTNATGAVFGMGVRCTSGTFKPLYTKHAVAGSITAPDLAAGEPQVSVRSAALGDAILAGQDRWYFVYYRDPIVLGGCPPASTFNATQTGRITWSP